MAKCFVKDCPKQATQKFHGLESCNGHFELAIEIGCQKNLEEVHGVAKECCRGDGCHVK